MKKVNTPARRYSGFILDADNTVFDFSACERRALEQTFGLSLGGAASSGRHRSAAPAAGNALYQAYRRINHEVWRELERGSIDQDTLRVKRFQMLLQELGRRGDPRQLSERYLEHFARKAYLMPHAAEVLSELSRRVPLVLLSNGIASVQRSRLGISGLQPLFRDILISEEVGLSKPDPRIFHLALQRLGRSRRQVLCVGDSPTADIAGARGAGLDSCWFAYPGMSYPHDQPQPDYVIADLRALLEMAA